MRLFFALPLEPQLRAQLVHWQQLWSKTVTNVKWVKEENLHLTLKFLGETHANQLELITSSARAALAGYPPFTLHVNGAGVFPNMRRARVLWVGLEDSKGQLFRLQQQLDKRLADVGFPLDSMPFTPHLTLGRLRQPSQVALPVFPVENLVVSVSHINLYESTLTPQGPLHETLATFELQ